MLLYKNERHVVRVNEPEGNQKTNKQWPSETGIYIQPDLEVECLTLHSLVLHTFSLNADTYAFSFLSRIENLILYLA